MGQMEAWGLGEDVSPTELDLLVQQALRELELLVYGQQDYKVTYLGTSLPTSYEYDITENPMADINENVSNGNSTTNTNVTEEDHSQLYFNATVTNSTNNSTNQSTSSSSLLDFERRVIGIQTGPCPEYMAETRAEDGKSCYCIMVALRFQDGASVTAEEIAEIAGHDKLQRQIDQLELPFTVEGFCTDGFGVEDTLIVDDGMEDEAFLERTDPPENPRTGDTQDGAASQTDNEADSSGGIPLVSRHQASNFLMMVALFELFA